MPCLRFLIGLASVNTIALQKSGWGHPVPVSMIPRVARNLRLVALQYCKQGLNVV